MTAQVLFFDVFFEKDSHLNGVEFIKMTNVNKKPRHTEAEKNLNDDISSYTKTINDLLVKLIFKELKKFNKRVNKSFDKWKWYS